MSSTNIVYAKSEHEDDTLSESEEELKDDIPVEPEQDSEEDIPAYRDPGHAAAIEALRTKHGFSKVPYLPGDEIKERRLPRKEEIAFIKARLEYSSYVERVTSYIKHLHDVVQVLMDEWDLERWDEMTRLAVELGFFVRIALMFGFLEKAEVQSELVERFKNRFNDEMSQEPGFIRE